MPEFTEWPALVGGVMILMALLLLWKVDAKSVQGGTTIDDLGSFVFLLLSDAARLWMVRLLALALLAAGLALWVGLF